MSWLRRRPRGGPEPVDAEALDPGAPDAAAPTGDTPSSGSADRSGADGPAAVVDDGAPHDGDDDAGDPAPDRTDGPHDVSEVGPEELADGRWVDLGALRLPASPGMELRLEVEEGSQRVVAATVVMGESAVQLQAFAAPRTRGIWRGVRREIATSLVEQGGQCEEVPGPYGVELVAQVPGLAPDGQVAHQLARFLGVDGPRWFLRGVLSGAAAADEAAAAPLRELLRGAVVVRGSEAMAPRDLLDLHLPRADEPATAGAPPG